MVEEILLSPLYFLNLHSLAFINVDAYIWGEKSSYGPIYLPHYSTAEAGCQLYVSFHLGLMSLWVVRIRIPY